ncbi:InlB B-repeat-containing protein [Methanorbis furvi]|uniref:Uncharacterized protein n=1 Tax=Methanorbis furvi TaxID=3028299 RepID=A0AAE4S953_9EURY|nr:hypothetical protein [Methanocorpusculaceae archaeon Ag1]
MLLRKCGTESPKKRAEVLARGGVIAVATSERRSGARLCLAIAALLLVCVLTVGAVSADEPVDVKNWDELYANLTAGYSVKLVQNINALNTSLNLSDSNKPVTLDLNGSRLFNTTMWGSTRDTGAIITLGGGNLTITDSSSNTLGSIESSWTAIVVKQGVLNLDKGTVKKIENTTNKAVVHGYTIDIEGSSSSNANKHSVVTIGPDAIVEGYAWAVGIGNNGIKAAYGIELDVYGILRGNQTASSLKNAYGSGGLTVNGNVQGSGNTVPSGNIPEIRIHDGAKIIGYNAVASQSLGAAKYNGAAVYGAGFANWTITGGTIIGGEALGIKSGKWYISGGEFTGNGLFADPAISDSNGSEPTGAALSVTTNHGYAKNVNITITGGNFTSTDQSAFYEGSSWDKDKGYQAGSALKMVAISGGNFKMNNNTLSAITIQNSGDTTNITDGISIKDKTGNNLLYRGVNLTSAGATPTFKWGGDNTSGYNLTISQSGNYKLMDSITLGSMDIPSSISGVTFDGNKGAGVQITLSKSPLKNPIQIKGTSVTLTNMYVTAIDGTAGANSNGVIQFSGVNGKLLNSKIDFSNINLDDSFAAVRLNGADSVVSGTEIFNGNSTTSSSQCIVVSGNNATITNNKLTPGTALKGLKKDGKTSSGSVAVRLTGDTSEKLTVTNNVITSTWSKDETTRNSGVSLDTSTRTSIEAVITNNTFTLNNANRTTTNNTALGGYGSVLYINPLMKNDDTAFTVNVDIQNNTVKKGTYLIYADGNDGAKSITVTGTVSYNNFATITGKKAENSTDVTTFTVSGITWTSNVEPAVPEVPSVTPTTDIQGNTVLTPTSSGDTSITDTTATIGNATTSTAVIQISGTGVSRDPGTGALTVPATAEIKAVYQESPAESPASVGNTEYQLNITLTAVDTANLPTISPAFNETKASQIAGKGYAVAAMITATGDVSAINRNITNGGYVEVSFKVPRVWADRVGLDRIVGFHIKSDGSMEGPLAVTRGSSDATSYTFIVKTSGFSTIAVAASTQPITTVPTYQPAPPVYSTSDGNMENAFRVLFDSKGGSFVQPATGLSYGDRITKPTDPERDGYTFAGWYKDEAGTIAWVFAEDAIPGDTTLYAKWISQGSGTTNAVATQAASAQTTQSSSVMQTASATQEATPSATTAPAGISPTMTQAPAPLFGMLAGLVAAGVLLRRRE